jgi:hypothetical protein
MPPFYQLPNYDKWKLQSPYDTQQNPLQVEHCSNCSALLYEGDSVLFDSGETYFCNKDCAKEYIIKNVEHLTDFIIDALLKQITL